MCSGRWARTERLRVLIPVNELGRAKGRLADVLAPAGRARLALATVQTVVEAVRTAGHEPVLLTRDNQVRAAFAGEAALMDEDPAAHGLNAQLESAITRLRAAGGLEELIILHADLPLARPEEIASLVAAAPPPPSATLVRSPDGGTNAMLLRPPGRFPLAYGPGSFERHAAAATGAGMAVATASAPGLELDLDTAADVEALMSTPAGRASAAGQVLAAARASAKADGQ